MNLFNGRTIHERVANVDKFYIVKHSTPMNPKTIFCKMRGSISYAFDLNYLNTHREFLSSIYNNADSIYYKVNKDKWISINRAFARYDFNDFTQVVKFAAKYNSISSNLEELNKCIYFDYHGNGRAVNQCDGKKSEYYIETNTNYLNAKEIILEENKFKIKFDRELIYGDFLLNIDNFFIDKFSIIENQIVLDKEDFKYDIQEAKIYYFDKVIFEKFNTEIGITKDGYFTTSEEIDFGSTFLIYRGAIYEIDKLYYAEANTFVVKDFNKLKMKMFDITKMRLIKIKGINDTKANLTFREAMNYNEENLARFDESVKLNHLILYSGIPHKFNLYNENIIEFPDFILTGCKNVKKMELYINKNLKEVSSN